MKLANSSWTRCAAIRMPLSCPLVTLATGVLLLAPLLVEQARACDENSVFDVRILPSPVVIVADESKSVAAVVGCRARYDPADGAWFKIRLVDVDTELGEPSHTADESGDDVLGTASITAPDPGTTDPVPIVAGHVFQLYCGSDLNKIDGTRGEGTGEDPADLALHISDGANFFRAAPGGTTVPARCMPEDVVPRLISLIYTGMPGTPRFPELPPSMDLGYGATFRVTSGGDHLQFITAAGGPLPDTLNVHVIRGGRLSAGVGRDQDAGQTIRVSGDGSFVEVSGSVSANGAVEAAGQGTVAGYPNIQVTLSGTLQGGILDAEYAMGTGGKLPGGFPIVFELTGASPEFTTFWDGTAEALNEFANVLAQFPLPTPAGGVDFEDALTRQAANLSIAASGFDHAPQSGIAETAFAGIGESIDALAEQVAASALRGAADAAAALRAAAQAARTSGEQFGALRPQPPGEALNLALTEWLGTLGQFEQATVTATQAVFGSDYLTAVPAASFVPGPLAPDSIASGFGAVGAPLAAAESLPLPTELGGVSLALTDSAGDDHLLGLFFSSDGQLNYLMPEEAAEGPALLKAFSDQGVLATGMVHVAAVAPSIFTANADGEGVPAAQVLRVGIEGEQTFMNAFQGAAGAYQPALIDLSDDSAQYFLQLYGSGFRHAGEVTVQIDGEAVPGVAFAANRDFAGLDQANVPLSSALSGKGVVDLTLEADGVAANVVRVGFE